MTPVFDAGSQALKVRALTWIFVLLAAAGVYYSIHLGFTYGTRPADGGVLAPLAVRLSWTFGLGTVSVAPAVGMLLYGRRFVARILFDSSAQRYHIHTLGLLGTRRHTYADKEIARGRYYRGRMQARVSVNAPWWTVRLGPHRVPFLIDAQGTIVDESRFRVFHNTRG